MRGSASIDVVFQRDGAHVVYLNDASGSYRGRQFVTPGLQPRVTPSQGVVFVACTGNYRQHPFVAIYRNGSSSGPRPDPGRRGPQVMAVTAAGAAATVLAAARPATASPPLPTYAGS